MVEVINVSNYKEQTTKAVLAYAMRELSVRVMKLTLVWMYNREKYGTALYDYNGELIQANLDQIPS